MVISTFQPYYFREMMTVHIRNETWWVPESVRE